jgi:hypothetical protein
MVDARVSSALDDKIAQLSRELCDLLGIAELDESILEALEFELENPFINGIEPMDFASFSLALDETPLSDHQLRIFTDAGIITARSFVSKNRKTRELICAWGKGAGKDWIIARFFAWVTYILHNMVNPKQYFRPNIKTVSDERIEIINIAPKGDLAKQVFFEYLARNFRRPFFKQYVTNERDQILTDRIFFPKLNLHILSLNSSASGLDGYNPLLWVMDEADAFLDNANKSNAEVLRRILYTSASTRWPGMWMGMIASYMRSGAGFMARTLTKFRKTPMPGVYIDQAASWDVNPNIRRDQEDVIQAYFEDPVAAAAMYEGIIPPVTDPFIHRHEYIRLSVGDHKGPAIFNVHRELGDLVYRDINGTPKAHVWVELEHLVPEPGRRYYAGVDAAESGDAFAISVFSVSDDGLLGPEHICPRCWGRGKDYYLQTNDKYAPAETTFNPENLVCGACGNTADAFTGRHESLEKRLSGWWLRGVKEQGKKLLRVGSEDVVMPHLREDVLLVLRPIPKRRSAELPDGAAVDFVSVQQVIKDLCRDLPIDAIGFDPHQMAGTIQYIASETTSAVHRIGFSNPEQFLRARVLRFFLYSGLITFAGENCATLEDVETGIQEAEQLQKIGQRLDHPPNGGKDTWDARSIATYLAITSNLAPGQIETLFRERTGEEVGAKKTPV